MTASTDALAECIRRCWSARHACQETLFGYCLVEGGHHSTQAHVQLMTDCIQVCQTAADFLTRGSAHYLSIVEACAEICEACADSCQDMEGTPMATSTEACRACAETCREVVHAAQLAYAS